MGSSPSFLDPVVLPLIRGSTILDAACGWGRWGCLIKTNYFECGEENPPAVDAFDAFEPNVEHARQLGVYRKAWKAVLPCPIPRNVYDTILASEVIEHLPLAIVAEVLDEFEAAANRRVVVTTPNWECLRGGSNSFIGFNHFDAHISFVSRSYLKDRGYVIFGAGIGNPRTFQARAFGRLLKILRIQDTDSLFSLSRYFPSLAHTVVAYKDVTAK